MVSGTDEHGTPIQVQADNEGVTPRELADRNALVIAKDLQKLGLSYDLFTRTTTKNHYAIDAGDLPRPARRTATSSRRRSWARSARRPAARCPTATSRAPARSAATRSARGDQCDNCGNQLDPIDLIDPRVADQRRDAEVRRDRADIPRPAGVRRGARRLAAEAGPLAHERPEVQPQPARRPQAARHTPATSSGACRCRWTAGATAPDKRIYVWFDAVVGYLSASIEWAQRTGDPEAWRPWWQDAGRPRLLLHGQGQHRLPRRDLAGDAVRLLGHRRQGRRRRARSARSNRPYEVVSSEFLTMEGRKFSSSRSVVIYVGDMLSRYDADALRYYLAVAGPENQDTDFTWSEFVRRNNDELVAGWGNLVNRTISMTAKNLGADPRARRAHRRRPRPARARRRTAFGTVGELLARSRQKAAIGEAMGVVACGEQVPVRHGAVEAEEQRPGPDGDGAARRAAGRRRREDAADPVPAVLVVEGARGAARRRASGRRCPSWSRSTRRPRPGSPSYSVLTGDYDTGARWESVPIAVGRPLEPPTPVFTKLDPSVVDEELARAGRRSDRLRPTAAPVFDAHTHLDAMAQRAGLEPTRRVRRRRRWPRRGRSAWSRRSRSATRWRPRAGAWPRRERTRTSTPRWPCTRPRSPASTTPGTPSSSALAADPRGGGGRRDRAGLLLGPHRAGRAAGALPPAHRPGQAGRQAADDPRPGRARRRAAHPARGGRARAGRVPRLLRRRGDGARVRDGRLRPVLPRRDHVHERAGAARGGRGRCPSTRCWSRPTRRSSPRIRSAAGRTRPGCCR